MKALVKIRVIRGKKTTKLFQNSIFKQLLNNTTLVPFIYSRRLCVSKNFAVKIIPVQL